MPNGITGSLGKPSESKESLTSKLIHKGYPHDEVREIISIVRQHDKDSQQVEKLKKLSDSDRVNLRKRIEQVLIEYRADTEAKTENAANDIMAFLWEAPIVYRCVGQQDIFNVLREFFADDSANAGAKEIMKLLKQTPSRDYRKLYEEAQSLIDGAYVIMAIWGSERVGRKKFADNWLANARKHGASGEWS